MSSITGPSGYKIGGTVAMVGFSSSSFSPVQQLDFSVALADTLDVPVADVKIIKLSDAVVGSSGSGTGVPKPAQRRLLHQNGNKSMELDVEFEVNAEDKAAEFRVVRVAIHHAFC
jgi:hypothetical protein